MQLNEDSKIVNALQYVSRKLTDLFHSFCEHAQPYLEHGLQKADPFISKSKQFYQDHKEVVLVVGVASLTYLMMRPKGKQEEKSKKKKVGPIKKQIANKTFMSDNSAEEPSTTIRVESSGKQVPKKKVEKRMLEKIQSSSEEEEFGDKIFFEMYRNYQLAQS